MLLSTNGKGRIQSISLTHVANQDVYENVDMTYLYESIVKILIIEYCNEARFKTPILKTPLEPDLAGISPSPSRSKRISRIYGVESIDSRLAPSVYTKLELHLNLIAMKKQGLKLDDTTRRSFLRFYSELLDPKVKADLKVNNTPDYLLMKFVACANKELMKLGIIPQSEISHLVFKQAGEFVVILKQVVEKEKNSEIIINKLNEHKDSLKPKNSSATSSSSSLMNLGNVSYTKPSFQLTDMDQGMVSLVQSLFHVEESKLQQDIINLKDLAQEKPLHNDVNQILFYLDKDLGQFNQKSFVNESIYNEWKLRERSYCELLTTKYPIPSSVKLLPTPKLPPGKEFYVIPNSLSIRPFYVTLIKLCLQLYSKENDMEDEILLSNHSQTLLSLCGKFWRIDPPTKAVCFFTAAHLSGILRDKLYPSDPKELAPVDINKTIQIFNYCQVLVASCHDKETWSLKDQQEWINNLTISYNCTMYAIKELVQMLFSKIAKPKFSPVLQLLSNYIESDKLFPKISQSGIPKKWEKRLSKVLIRTAEIRYAELLENLPRDYTLNISHVLEISETIVRDIETLQKRYPNPLLGFLHVPRTVAIVITSMFAVDSKNILKHIESYYRQSNQDIPFGDSLEAYKSLYQIRDLYNQVNPTSNAFKFNLEKFFFASLNQWVQGVGDRISSIVNEAIKNDNFEPIDIDNDKKFSTSVMDIFRLVKEYLTILDNLKWANEYQLAKIYTVLLKAISDGVLKYTYLMGEKITSELQEDTKKVEAEIDKRKSMGWFDEMKSVVNNIQITSKIEVEDPYNFKPTTCVALNNLSAMMHQLTQLEDILDPELILNTITSHEPTTQQNFTSHIFSIRIIRAENLSCNNSTANLKPYVSLIDTKRRKTVCKTRTINNTTYPEWDEEFELNLAPNSPVTLSVTVWDEKLQHSVCGRAVLQLDPRRFKHDGTPQEIMLDLDTQGRVLMEVAVESERVDAIFALGRAHRCLKRCQNRCIKLIVEKFSRFIHLCFSRSNLRSICGNLGHIKPTQTQMDEAMMPLYDYLNSNLQVLAQYLTKDLLLHVMIATWQVVVFSADELLLPKLSTAKTFNLSHISTKIATTNSTKGDRGWQSAVSSAVANVTNSIGISGFGKLLTNNELETVFSWLNFLCFDFFHNDGNGPPIEDLKNETYQTLLLLPVYYDGDIDYLKLEVDRLSPAFVKGLQERNSFNSTASTIPKMFNPVTRTGLIARSQSITANATSKLRAKAAKELNDAKADPVAAQTSAEDIILRLLLLREEKAFVAKRLEQRERLAHSIATEQLARAAAEGKFTR